MNFQMTVSELAQVVGQLHLENHVLQQQLAAGRREMLALKKAAQLTEKQAEPPQLMEDSAEAESA